MLVILMAVNNEVGTIEPVLPVTVSFRNLIGNTTGWFHTDGVQSFGKLEFTERAI